MFINCHPNQRGSQMINAYDTNPTGTAQVLPWSKSLPDDDNDTTEQTRVDSEINFSGQPSKLAGASLDSLTIGLIDFYRLTQECLTKVFDDLQADISIYSFMTVKERIAEARNDRDLIIYYLHGSEASDATVMQAITTVCQAFPTIPVIVFSDADCTQQSKIIRSTLKSGARGSIPTRAASLPITLAAIRFVKAGGTFVPVDLL